MSVAIHDTIADPVANPIVPRRPPWISSVLLDALLGGATYVASYWLRFDGERLALFLPTAWSTMPIVVAGQIAALLSVNAYAPRPRTSWLSRVVVGAALGTAAAALVTRIVQGFEGVSRMAFVADALLFSIAAIGWRGAWVLRARAQARARARAVTGALVDRTDDMTLGAVLASRYHYRGLLRALVLKDLKLKYRGSVFGFLWSLANPLLMIVVYTIAFTVILRIRNEMFVFYLMLGQLSWSFFANSMTMATGSIVENGGLLRTVLFPRAILPIGTVLFNLAQYLLTIAVFLPVMMAWYHVAPVAPMLLFPVLLALQVIFTIGVALLLATITAFFRDVKHLVEIALAVLFWMTPIVYEVSQVPERLKLLILLSPISPYVAAYQKVFFYREWPEPTVWLVASTYAIGAFVVGAASILAFEDRFTEHV
jgi:homopolymeric O-antigen transport system permease protein